MLKKRHKPRSELRRMLSPRTVIQSLVIVLVAVFGTGTASVLIEQFLLREALRTEAEHFWLLHYEDQNFPTPNTRNLKGYLTLPNSTTLVDGTTELLEGLDGHGLGYHKMHGQIAHSLLYVSEQSGKRLYLLFDGESVWRLAVFFGVFPLIIVLLLVYLTSWWVYRESTMLLNPIVWLANKVDRFDPAHLDANLDDLDEVLGDANWEVKTLYKSFRSYSRRIQHFIDRERTFTRDASHEFRTPLTVINMASDMLITNQGLDTQQIKYVNRIKGSARDMEELIDAFLILARETDKEFEDVENVISEIIEREIKIAQVYLENKPLTIHVHEETRLTLVAARNVLSIVLGNLLRNAVLYTNEGKVNITLRDKQVEIKDTGIGMSQGQIERIFQPYYRADNACKTKRKGYGVGLTIVQRLCNRFNWTIHVSSEVGVGSTFVVDFGDTKSIDSLV